MPCRASTIAAAVAGVLLLVAPARAEAPDDKARHDDIRKLLTLNGGGQLGVQAARQMMTSLRPLVPGAPDAFWDDFMARLDPDELVERVVPIYAKHLSAEDVKALIVFYESPAGRNLTRALPSILQESMAAGQAWGQQIAKELIRTARAKGFEVKDL